jgi:hypothetical protein
MNLLEINYAEKRQKVDLFRNKIYQMETMASKAVVTNSELETLSIRKQKAKAAVDGLELLIHIFNTLHIRAMKEDTAFKDRRVVYVTAFITESISKIFPTEQFTAKIKFDPSRNTSKAYLRLLDRSRHERIPHMSEGKMMQQSLSFASSIGIQRSLNKDKTYVDEAFAAGSPESHQKISSLLLEELERGAQIFMIEQKSEGYKDLPRREFHLYKDPETEVSHISGVYDF